VKLVNPPPIIPGSNWHTIELNGWSKKNNDDDKKLICYIDVSEPLFINYVAQGPGILSGEFFVPVTKEDTWRIANANGALPLTRAVADQAHNYALSTANGRASTAVEFIASAPLEDFEKFSRELCGTGVRSHGRDIYKKKVGKDLVSGAHKLWVLSAVPGSKTPKAINYGAYVNRALTPEEVRAGGGPGGPYLEAGWNVIQACHGAHNSTYKDYSQLLQLMRNLRIAKDSQEYIPLKQAVKDGLHQVWDEHPNLLSWDDLAGL
jgi:hypothetical protein